MTERRTWSQSDSMIPSRFIRPARRFMQLEAASGLVLIGAAVVALLWANLPFGESYEKFWETRLLIELGPIDLSESLRDVVNDALMTLFFFVVGLEIKRETRLGDLSDRSAAAGPGGSEQSSSNARPTPPTITHAGLDCAGLGGSSLS